MNERTRKFQWLQFTLRSVAAADGKVLLHCSATKQHYKKRKRKKEKEAPRLKKHLTHMHTVVSQ